MSCKSALLLLTTLYFFPAHAEDTPQHQIEKYLESMNNSGFGYSVLVSLDGNIMIQRGYGWSDVSKKCQTDDRTLFNIASITKSFTAIAIFQLRNQGKLKLEDTLPKFFKSVPKEKQSITIQHLMAHTSGLEQNYAADGKKTRDEAVQAILSDALAFQPGTAFSYSNENYELLAAIIEVSSGSSYEQYVREHILDKAKMTATKFWNEVDPSSGCAVASTKREIGAALGTRDWGFIGSGGIFSTAGDLNRWFTALINGSLIPAGDLELMWKSQWKASSTDIALGWFVSRTYGNTEIWTRGTEDWGHNAVLRWFPEKKLLVIVTTNSGEMGDKNTTGNRLISDRIVEILIPQSGSSRTNSLSRHKPAIGATVAVFPPVSGSIFLRLQGLARDAPAQRAGFYLPVLY